tara:strand:- start:922 stop:1491 length:570 start_codon:yes stop_codon:yes gene_type:complete
MEFDFKNFANSYFNDIISTISEFPVEQLEEFWKLVEKTRNSGKTVHFIGNGGSSGTPSHSAGDWSKELSLKTISHTDNSSSLTAWANDTSFENIFLGQLSTFLTKGDLVVGFSGSGNSMNVLNGLIYAKDNGCTTVGVTGNYNEMGGGKMISIVDLSIVIPTKSMERIEDFQLIINHIIKEAVKSNNNL